MFKRITIFSLTALVLCGCARHPQSYCHQLANKIAAYQHSGSDRNKVNPAQRATLIQQYKSLDCEDQ